EGRLGLSRSLTRRRTNGTNWLSKLVLSLSKWRFLGRPIFTTARSVRLLIRVSGEENAASHGGRRPGPMRDFQNPIRIDVRNGRDTSTERLFQNLIQIQKLSTLTIVSHNSAARRWWRIGHPLASLSRRPLGA